MAHMVVDGNKVEYTDEKNVLDVIRLAGIELPTFCYYTELSIYGACRMCVVENEWGGIISSCSEQPKDGMIIKTNTTKIQKHRKMILELLLASHCRDCTTCEKNTRCKLQELAMRFNIKTVRFENTKPKFELETSSPALVIDSNKCILCGDCVRVCSESQEVSVIDFVGRGSSMRVGTAFGIAHADTKCVNCGQCAAVCPTGAIVIKNETDKAWAFIQGENFKTIVQVAPAVRVALGEEFDIPSGENVMGKIAAALRKLGFDEVYDMGISADLTVMEEADEFLERLEKNENLPLFTSCCPAWVKYVEEFHPDLIANVSTCRSPMGMLGAIIKEQGRSMTKLDGKKRVSVAIVPCTAKKFEAARKEISNEGEQDVELVLTTQELVLMIKEAGLDFKAIEPEAVDMPFGIYSGGGIIFGTTGGVTEAVLRRCTAERTVKAVEEIAYTGVRGFQGIKEAEIELGGRKIKIAVVHGLANAEKVVQSIKSGEADYQFVEFMACPGGCVSGAGQPKTMNKERVSRSEGLYNIDKQTQIKRSDENPILISMYNGILKNKKSKLLHVHYGKK